MHLESDQSSRRPSGFVFAVAVSISVGATVLALLAFLNPGRDARLVTHSVQSVHGAQAPASLKSAMQGDWLRKTPGWSVPLNADPALPAAPQARLDVGLAQQRLASHIADRFRLDRAQAASVVALAYGVADEVAIDPLLLLAVIAVESSFDAMAQSARGAQGLMQIRTQLHAARFEPFGGPEAAFDPHANIRVGAELLRGFLVREGSVEAALKMYVGAARRPHDGGYGARVLGARDWLRGVAQAREELVLRATPESPPRLGAGS